MAVHHGGNHRENDLPSGGCKFPFTQQRKHTSAHTSPHLKLRESGISESGMVPCARSGRRGSSCGGAYTKTRYFLKYHSRNRASFSASSKSRAQGMNASQPRTLLPPPLKPDLAPSREVLEAGEVVITSKLRYMERDGSMATSLGGGRTIPLSYFLTQAKSVNFPNCFTRTRVD